MFLSPAFPDQVVFVFRQIARLQPIMLHHILIIDSGLTSPELLYGMHNKFIGESGSKECESSYQLWEMTLTSQR